MSLRLFRSVYRFDRLLMMSAIALCTLASVGCGGGGSTTSQQTLTSQFSYAVKLDATPDELKRVTGYRAEIEWTNTPCP